MTIDSFNGLRVNNELLVSKAGPSNTLWFMTIILSTDSSSLSKRGLELLSMGSPFFDVLWPVIFSMADQKTRNTLHVASRYFRRMWKRQCMHAHSVQAKEEYKEILAKTEHPVPSEFRLNLSVENELWYSWSANEADFYVHWNFEEFCRLADIDIFHGYGLGQNQGYIFVSRTGDLTVRIQRIPRAMISGEEYFEFNVHRLGCTGERKKAKKLEEWWMSHCTWQQMRRGCRILYTSNRDELGELF
ncbi:hypothetical protein K435DRAFT_965843 [Dendrothele bispora CBS 962.96]|uniref:Uncharacterized protein n=1 Tax=Dendrothele bispora (strain CBS 962.96) TaxID=1314807 RepID=A0A4S8M4X5_DENBC|nr:hypothetical protein K435DRAFT_965843 [Dendrothele bispora CBS 962.96]